MDDSPLAFRDDPREAAEIEIAVNFGVFAGRDATLAEIDDLGRELLGVLRRVSIVSQRRHELGHELEAAVHQVRVEADAGDALEATDGDKLADRLLELTDAWARRAIEFRHAEVSEVEALP